MKDMYLNKVFISTTECVVFGTVPEMFFWYSTKNQKLLGLGRVSDFSFILLRSGFGFFDFFLPLLRIIQFFSKNCLGRAGLAKTPFGRVKLWVGF